MQPAPSILLALQRELEQALIAHSRSAPHALRAGLELALADTFDVLLECEDESVELVKAFIQELAIELALYVDDLEADELAGKLGALVDAALSGTMAVA